MASLPVGTVLAHPCPGCGQRMTLRKSRYGLFYGCEAYPACKGTHGAHPDGRPLGIPGDEETKRWRHLAHEAFDRLWKGGMMRRHEAYRWMQAEMNLTVDEAHIARLDRQQCIRLIAAVEEHLDRQRFG